MRHISSIVNDNIDELVASFYETFLADEQASAFLSHAVVQQRLSNSLRNWMLEIVQVDLLGDTSAFDKRQIKIGEVHARLKIPNHLVLEGSSYLKTDVAFKLARLNLDAESTTASLILFDEIVDHSMRLMSSAYFTDTERRVQTDEAFRLFSLGQDINLERETQRAALMEWSQSVVFRLFGYDNQVVPPTLSNSQFGLWLRHRAALLFQGAPALASIEALVGEIDAQTLPNVNSADPDTVKDLQRRIDEIKFLLSELFQLASTIENGRDPLTRTLSRRFLPSVLGREMAFAKRGKTPLSVLMLDIDHFKAINDQFGHSAGDVALSITAELLLDTVRASDFVFRYGGEEFLIVLVETDLDAATVAAERIRSEVAAKRISLPNGTSMTLTVSIGIAGHEGHPDYQFLIDAADRALYSAKRAGRNRVVLADPSHLISA
jgi:diguanylate cyclase